MRLRYFYAFIKAPSDQGLDDQFLNAYLETSRENLATTVLETSGFVDAYKTSIESMKFTQDEIDISIPVLEEILPYFTTVTKDLQDFLDLSLLRKNAETKALASMEKRNLNEKAAETAVDLEALPAVGKPDLVGFIRDETKKQVSSEAKKQVSFHWILNRTVNENVLLRVLVRAR